MIDRKGDLHGHELAATTTHPRGRLAAINALLLDPNSSVVNDVLDVIAKYGTPEEINRQAEAARNCRL